MPYNFDLYLGFCPWLICFVFVFKILLPVCVVARCRFYLTCFANCGHVSGDWDSTCLFQVLAIVRSTSKQTSKSDVRVVWWCGGVGWAAVNASKLRGSGECGGSEGGGRH